MDKQSVLGILKNLIIKFRTSTDLAERVQIAQEHSDILQRNIHLFEDDISNGVPEHEVWRNIKGFEGIYQISSWGNVKCVERFFIKNRKGGKDKMAVYREEKIRLVKCNPNGYPTVSLWRNGKGYHHLTHRLVGVSFVENENGYANVLHIDNNPLNPKWNNLKWGTQSQNIIHCVQSLRGFVGTLNGNSKLNEDNVKEIRRLLTQKMSLNNIAAKFGVSKSPILSIKQGKTWAAVKD